GGGRRRKSYKCG
ncbi:hypothetical protein CSPAE12_04944, partial [Colletotrichum incanum]